jgi:hypothetical protein
LVDKEEIMRQKDQDYLHEMNRIMNLLTQMESKYREMVEAGEKMAAEKNLDHVHQLGKI